VTAANISVATAQIPTPAPKKRSMLPVLTFLFVVSYALMTFLIIEQAKTIESQRGLIRALFGDSVELTNLKGKAVQERNAAKMKAEAQAQQHAPGAHVQAPNDKTQNDRKANEDKAKKHAFPKPPQAASDKPDARRALLTI
jgi:hypothetical protein